MWEWARYYFIELRLNQKLGIDKARDVLNELGIPAPRGTQWATTCLYSAERNVSLIGTGMYNKRQFGENAGGKIKDKKEWIIIENAHPALLTPEEFKGLEILRQNKLKRSGTITKFQKHYVNMPKQIILNILLCRISQMLTSKRLTFDESGRINIQNWYSMLFVPSGGGKDRITKDFDQFVLGDFYKWFTEKSDELYLKQIKELENETIEAVENSINNTTNLKNKGASNEQKNINPF